MMNRLQKKCLIATAGFHLTLVLVLIFGAAFFSEHTEKPDDTQLLDVIPANLIDQALSSGVKGAQPPPSTPITQPPVQPPQPKPEQPQPKPVVETPPPKPDPAPTLMEKVEKIFKPEPPKPAKDDVKPVEKVEKPAKPAPKKIAVNLKPVVRNTTSSTDTSAADAKRERDARLKAIASVASSIKENTSTSTEIDMPGTSSAAYAGYDQAVLSIYNKAWISPEGVTSGEEVVKVRVIVSRDGTVISARIIDFSGDSKVDKSVQQALDRVKTLRPFPEGSKENQRTIEFNFKTKARSLLG